MGRERGLIENTVRSGKETENAKWLGEDWSGKRKTDIGFERTDWSRTITRGLNEDV